MNKDHRMLSDILVNVFLFDEDNVLVRDVPGKSLLVILSFISYTREN